MANTVQGHTAPSSNPAARQFIFSDLLAALAAAMMAACEPRKARPPCNLAALQRNNSRDGKGSNACRSTSSCAHNMGSCRMRLEQVKHVGC